MALAFVQGVSSTGTAGTSPQAAPAFGSSIAVGDLIVVLAGGDGGVTGLATSVADTYGNTYTRVPSFDFANVGGTLNMDCFYAVVTTGGASNVVTLTFNDGGENCVLVVQHFNGFTGTATYDQKSTSSNASSTTCTSGASPTTTQATELVVGLGIHASTTSAFSLGSGYTNLTQASVANRQAAMESKVVSSTGAQTATFTIAAARVNMGGVVTFYDAAGGPPSASVTQVAANVTATGGTQVAATSRFSTVAQVAATVTATGGTQAVVPKTTVAQVAASVTATGGTQAVSTVRIASVTQVAGSVTATGGTQAIIVFQGPVIAQVAASVTATGGIQAVSAASNSSVAQVAASVTATGGTQAISLVAGIAQVAATVTATGGTQAATGAQGGPARATITVVKVPNPVIKVEVVRTTNIDVSVVQPPKIDVEIVRRVDIKVTT